MYQGFFILNAHIGPDDGTLFQGMENAASSGGTHKVSLARRPRKNISDPIFFKRLYHSPADPRFRELCRLRC
jgi:hypothetical protein